MKLMKIITFFHISVLYYLFSYVNCIWVILSPSKDMFCVNKFFGNNSELKMLYYISGDNEYNIKSTIKFTGENEKGKIVFEKEKKSDSLFQLEINNDAIVGTYQLCFSLQSGTETILAFEYLNTKDASHNLIKLAKDDSFQTMNRNITDISNIFDSIEQNLKFYAERSETHNKGKNQLNFQQSNF